MTFRTFLQTSLLLSYFILGCKDDTVSVSTTPPPQQSSGYYVSVTGNDNNPGTLQQPWRTIQRAANTLIAGDTVYVMSGTYNERVIPQNSGTSGNYIVYSTYQNQVVTIDGSGITLPDDLVGLFHIAWKNYIKVSGFRLINAGPNMDNAGILVIGSSYITLSGNSTYSTVSSGIGVWLSDNITIDSNDINLACNNGRQECITVAGTNLFEIKNNIVYNGGPGTN